VCFRNDNVRLERTNVYRTATATKMTERSPDFHTAELLNTKSCRLLSAGIVNSQSHSPDKYA
jgi:hypothetical protein